MYLQTVSVEYSKEIAENVWVIGFYAPNVAKAVLPGQFLNVKPDASFDPLLRRAYSVHRVQGELVELIYNVHGRGSAIFAVKRPGDPLDIMGPLGVPFHLEGEFTRAILISGGLGIAPMPILGDELHSRGIDVVNIHGARSAKMIVQDDRLRNPIYATDDGSLGFHGNVVGALAEYLDKSDHSEESLRLFACGPNRMLESLASFCDGRGLPLEVSLECQMACGIGICQGCPVEMKGGERKYTLVCTHGPNYDVQDILLESLPVEHG
ncbi:MAG: dihydroorotate dehydrogenase electron transfer subunit [Ignavibacteriae bacterium]|nr:dihydroorotate dehydrogenase electron transfer subunit [Ignavibacteriota bacterium]MCB9215298.1 dihydroorotate dehydrogenase electron transfer subunit [Ignavibacteria bacterium]